MKFALFVIAVCILTLHATTVAAIHGYVYTVAEAVGKQSYYNTDFEKIGYTGFVKIGHSSESNHKKGKFSNLYQRFCNMQTGNPRRLELKRVYECSSKKVANDAENFIRDYIKEKITNSANNLGGSDEWIYINKIRSAKIIAVVDSIATEIKGCKVLDNTIFPPNLFKMTNCDKLEYFFM